MESELKNEEELDNISNESDFQPFTRSGVNRRSKRSTKSDKSAKASLHLPLDINKVLENI